MNRQTKTQIKKAIELLQLTKEDLKTPTTKQLNAICEHAKTSLYNVMYYLRYEK